MVVSTRYSDELQQSRGSLAAAYAHCDYAVVSAAPLGFAHDSDGLPSARRAEWVAERDCPAVHIHSLGVEAELADDLQ